MSTFTGEEWEKLTSQAEESEEDEDFMSSDSEEDETDTFGFPSKPGDSEVDELNLSQSDLAEMKDKRIANIPTGGDESEVQIYSRTQGSRTVVNPIWGSVANGKQFHGMRVYSVGLGGEISLGTIEPEATEDQIVQRFYDAMPKKGEGYKEFEIRPVLKDGQETNQAKTFKIHESHAELIKQRAIREAGLGNVLGPNGLVLLGQQQQSAPAPVAGTDPTFKLLDRLYTQEKERSDRMEAMAQQDRERVMRERELLAQERANQATELAKGVQVLTEETANRELRRMEEQNRNTLANLQLMNEKLLLITKESNDANMKMLALQMDKQDKENNARLAEIQLRADRETREAEARFQREQTEYENRVRRSQEDYKRQTEEERERARIRLEEEKSRLDVERDRIQAEATARKVDIEKQSQIILEQMRLTAEQNKAAIEREREEIRSRSEREREETRAKLLLEKEYADRQHKLALEDMERRAKREQELLEAQRNREKEDERYRLEREERQQRIDKEEAERRDKREREEREYREERIRRQELMDKEERERKAKWEEEERIARRERETREHEMKIKQLESDRLSLIEQRKLEREEALEARRLEREEADRQQRERLEQAKLEFEREKMKRDQEERDRERKHQLELEIRKMENEKEREHKMELTKLQMKSLEMNNNNSNQGGLMGMLQMLNIDPSEAMQKVLGLGGSSDSTPSEKPSALDKLIDVGLKMAPIVIPAVLNAYQQAATNTPNQIPNAPAMLPQNRPGIPQDLGSTQNIQPKQEVRPKQEFRNQNAGPKSAGPNSAPVNPNPAPVNSNPQSQTPKFDPNKLNMEEIQDTEPVVIEETPTEKAKNAGMELRAIKDSRIAIRKTVQNMTKQPEDKWEGIITEAIMTTPEAYTYLQAVGIRAALVEAHMKEELIEKALKMVNESELVPAELKQK